MFRKTPDNISHRVAFYYFVAAAIYIYVSDKVLLALITDQSLISYYQTYKGWGFVLVTAALLFLLLRRNIQLLITEMAERERAEKAEKEAARQWQQTFDASADAICLITPDKTIIRVNRAMAEIIGEKPENLVGENCCEALHGKETSFDQCLLMHDNDFKRRKELELQIGNRWYIVSMDPVYNDQGELEHIVHILRDITVRKNIEASVRAQRNTLSSLFSLTKLMRTAKSAKELLSVVLEESRKLLQADDGSVTILSDDGSHFKIVEAEELWSDHINYQFSVKSGLCSRVLDEGKPYFTDNYSDEARELHFLNQSEITGPMLLVPLKAENETIGILEVSRRIGLNVSSFSSEEIELLTAIGEIAGSALHRQRLYESAEMRLMRLQGLRNIDMAISGSLDLSKIFDTILSEVTTLLGLDAASILRFEAGDSVIYYVASHGLHTEEIPSLQLQKGEGFAGSVVQSQKPLYIYELSDKEYSAVQGALLKKERFVSYYAVPLIAKGRILGVLEAYSRSRKDLGVEWIDYLESLAGQAAIAVENADLFRLMEKANLELLQAYDATLDGWARALDLKDVLTEEHSKRVINVTLNIARKMNIIEEDLPHIKRGAMLHDIGKMGIPDSILLKPGPLTEEEWEVMRKHPVYAYDLLSRIDYLKPALEIPFCHHEKWDGTGYPGGLKGEDIPLAARIFAVVDVYDALTSDRPYRKAWSKEDAIKRIKETSGKHFDPEVVKIFLEEV